MDDNIWYASGLRFECSQCGNCCTGAPGYVWVNKAEIQQMAAQMGAADLAMFQKKYVRQVGVRKSLKERGNGDCIFFDGATRQCQVYASRPRQCRTWPFWQSNVRTATAWRETCRVCPGSGVGRLYTLSEIKPLRDTIRI